MADFVMPILGADMTEGTLVAWLKQPGDHVQRGDIVAEVETDKGLIEIEIFTAGVIEQLLVQPGEKVPVGAVLAVVREDEPAPQPAAAPGTAVPPPQPVAVAGTTAVPAAVRQRISPAARKLAADLGVDLSAIEGTGPGGVISREDVERVARARETKREPVARGAAPSDLAARMRQTIGAAMARSKREIPHYYLSTTIDMHGAMAWLAEENRKRPIAERLLHSVLLIKSVALALREVPELNAIWSGTAARISERVHIGVAISLRQGGLVSPALHDSDRQTVDELMRRLRDLVNRARAGTLRSSELSDPTITVTNVGEQGVEALFGIIYPPQTAIVGFGKVVERPWCVDGQIVSRPVLTATLSADHRVTDGHRGARFLAAVDRLLQEPSRL